MKPFSFKDYYVAGTFDVDSNWNWISKNSSNRKAEFVLPDNTTKVKVEFEKELNEDCWYLSFTNDSHKYSNSSQEFATTMDIAKNFLESVRPGVLCFEGKNDNKFDKILSRYEYDLSVIGYALNITENKKMQSKLYKLEKRNKNGY